MIHDEHIKNIPGNILEDVVVVKAGSSVLPDNESYPRRAKQIIEVLESYNLKQLIVVCSARKNETQETIESIAGTKSNVLLDALYGKMDTEFESHDIAKTLITPEINAAYRLMDSVKCFGYNDVSVLEQNNPDYPIIANSCKLKAKLDMDMSKKKAGYISSLSRLVITSGFGAVNDFGEIVCLGKGSSDDVAKVFGEITTARRVLLLKDEEGICDCFGTDYQKKFDYLSGEEAKTMGGIVNPSVFDICPGSGLELRVGHYKDIVPLVGGMPGYGTVILDRGA